MSFVDGPSNGKSGEESRTFFHRRLGSWIFAYTVYLLFITSVLTHNTNYAAFPQNDTFY